MAGIIGAAMAGAAKGLGIGAANVGKQALDHEYEKEKQAILAQGLFQGLGGSPELHTL